MLSLSLSFMRLRDTAAINLQVVASKWAFAVDKIVKFLMCYNPARTY